MKTIKLTTIILIVIMMVSCSLSNRQKNEIINDYSAKTICYTATFEGMTTPSIYCIAYDKYEAMRYFDEQLEAANLPDKPYKVDMIDVPLVYKYK